VPAISYFDRPLVCSNPFSVRAAEPPIARTGGAPNDRGSKEVRDTVAAPGVDDRVEQAGLLRQVWVREGA
jgi:hypothetical protein